MGSGGSAPKPDPNIGKAALKSAETGEAMMAWMKDQAAITNVWAAEDRDRSTSVFQPLQDQYIEDAKDWASPERKETRANQAAADVANAAAQSAGTRERQAMAMGVNPASGRYQSAEARAGTDIAMATAGAKNLARRTVDNEGEAKIANAINMGSGLAVNPATSMGLSNGAGQAGFGGAMSGYGQQADILNKDYQNRMSAWQAEQQQSAGLFGALGSVAGALGPKMFPTLFASSKKVKHDMKPAKGNLEATRKMPVGEWTYNEGKGDGGRHIGPYAEDFQKATKKGDGKTIDVISLMGITLGAVQELDRKVSKMEQPKAPAPKRKSQAMGVAA